MLVALRPDPFEPTHELLALPAEDYEQAVAAVLDVALNHASEATLLLDPDELSAGWPNEDDVADAFDDLRDRLERVEDPREGDEEGVAYAATLPEDRAALDAFLDSRPSGCWANLVRAIQLGADDWSFFEIPHHADAWVDVSAASRPEEYEREIETALSGLRACIVPAGTRVTWRDRDKRYRVTGGSLCVETLDGSRERCLSLSGLDDLEVDDAAHAIRLDWDPGPTEPTGIQRAFGALLGALGPDPPVRLTFTDEERFRRCAAVLWETLETYRA